jgi:hypothetical protein
MQQPITKQGTPQGALFRSLPPSRSAWCSTGAGTSVTTQAAGWLASVVALRGLAAAGTLLLNPTAVAAATSETKLWHCPGAWGSSASAA